MKSFTAWLAMGLMGRPMKRSVSIEDGNAEAFTAFTNGRTANKASAGPPQRVLIVPDTEENRRKLGMEEA